MPLRPSLMCCWYSGVCVCIYGSLRGWGLHFWKPVCHKRFFWINSNPYGLHKEGGRDWRQMWVNSSRWGSDRLWIKLQWFYTVRWWPTTAASFCLTLGEVTLLLSEVTLANSWALQWPWVNLSCPLQDSFEWKSPSADCPSTFLSCFALKAYFPANLRTSHPG